METTERRRSDRVSLFSAIRVRGTDAAGERFSVEARTVLLTLHGAAIIINRELAPNQKLNIRCYGMGTEAEAGVVARIDPRPEMDFEMWERLRESGPAVNAILDHWRKVWWPQNANKEE
jgi:hypothetical protein